MQNTLRSNKGSLSGYTLGANQQLLEFQFNPTSIRERRGAVYNFSEAQGQVLPQAQYGRVDNTEISFELFMFHHNGVDISKLRALTLPKQLSNLTYYTQSQPDLYLLDLDQYGAFVGAITSVEMTTDQYHKITLKPIRVRAQIKFVQVSVGANVDLNYL